MEGGKQEAREDGGEWVLVGCLSAWHMLESSEKMEQSRYTALRFITKITQ